MKKWKECPWYIWIFSFFAGVILTWVTMVQFAVSFFRRKFSFDLWLRYCGEFFIDWFLLFLLPVVLLSLLAGNLAPELWYRLAFPVAYILGLYPAVRMWHWRKINL